MPRFQVRVYYSQQLQAELTAERPIVVGRQDPKLDDPGPINLHECEQVLRLVVAPADQMNIPRTWFGLMCTDDGRVSIENLHSTYEVPLRGGESVAVGETRVFASEVLIELGSDIVVHVSHLGTTENDSSKEYRRLDSTPPMPGAELVFDPTMTIRQLPGASGHATLELLKLALQVVQTAAGSEAFFQKAVEATKQIVDLERAMVLMRSDAVGVEEIATSGSLPDGWCTVAECLAPRIDPLRCPPVSTSILSRVDSDEKKTVIHDPGRRDVTTETAPSLQGVHCVVASPILNTHGDLIGVLYGDRWTHQRSPGENRISELEATLVEVLAGAVAGGVARKSEERRRGTLSGFFSPRVADLLTSSPELLLGKDADISVLFCDIRGFSSVTEKLGPRKTTEWINDVLTELSICVLDTDGVLADYIGDALMAMWGAPGDQSDHARRSVQTAIAMLKVIESLRVRWADVLPRRFGAGIGVNSGPARVGNVGSKLKFKYGILGNTVNVSSRLQAATKQLQVDCMVSRQTATEAGYIDKARRLAKLSVVGIEEPIDVYQIVHQPDSDWETLIREYETALTDFEQGRLSAAARRLGELIERYPNDRPCRQLLARTADQLNDPTGAVSPIWKLSKK